MLFKLGKSTITSKYIKQITSFSSFELGSQQHEKRTKSFCYFFLLSQFSPKHRTHTHTHKFLVIFPHAATIVGSTCRCILNIGDERPVCNIQEKDIFNIRKILMHTWLNFEENDTVGKHPEFGIGMIPSQHAHLQQINTVLQASQVY